MFFRFLYLKKIKLPASLKNISSKAFKGCILIEEIDEIAFKNSGITKITLPDSLEAIGPEAFSECKNLKSVPLPSTLKKNCSSAFAASALKEILIPESAGTGSSAFYKCGELTKATVKNPEGMVSSYIFSYCENLEEVNLPQSLTSIGKSSFHAEKN